MQGFSVPLLKTRRAGHRSRRFSRSLAALATAALLLAARESQAQAWAYPSFQPPTTTSREFNFGIADAGNAGTSVLFQWREGFGPSSQFSFDIGVGDPDARGADNVLFLGGQYAYQIAKASEDVPLDFLLTAGAGLAFGNHTSLRVPMGVSIGHRFPLDGTIAITPYVHPRMSLDFCGGCNGDESQIGISFDVGANLELTRVLAIRGTAFFGGSDRFGEDGIGISLVWTPPGLRR